MAFSLSACVGDQPTKTTQTQTADQQTQDESEPQPPSKTQKDIGDLEPDKEMAQQTQETKPIEQKPSPQDHKITIARYAFSPKTVEINAGDRVIWKNLGKTPHEVMSSEFHSNPLFQNDEVSHVFNQKGEYTINSARYHATQGKIIVK